jgi:mono/diheme cytochrome c family protein
MKTSSSPRAVTFAALAATLALFAGAPSFPSPQNASTTQRSTYAALSKVPAQARAMTDPLNRDQNAIAAGHILFEEHCAQCHGAQAAGTRRGPDLRNSHVMSASSGSLFWILSNGVIRHGMPDWSKLPEPERWQIVTFLKSLKDREENQPSR